MIHVKYQGRLLATFASDDAEEDAREYIERKYSKIMQAFAAEQVAKYIQEHPYTRHGTKTLPGDVPLSETYPAYKAYADELKNCFSLE